EDMKEILVDIGGNGIAAPQVHEPIRMFVYRVREDIIPEGSTMKSVPWTVVVNPVLTPLTEDTKLYWERCLSLPGLHGQVPRFTHIRLEAVGLDGAPIELDVRGFHARLLQHEYDHLDGILYPMRMQDMSKLSFSSELDDSVDYPPRNIEDFVG
ncbi:MAG: peptide deformylase, partial [Alphaproteobacteria bacterium]|nr:peptide deformylase [Alphaproteobacteria bacterium]